jgi:hypothetical protein
MNKVEVVEAIVESNFQNESISVAEIVKYITQRDVFFGICEEPEDLNHLRQSYEE